MAAERVTIGFRIHGNYIFEAGACCSGFLTGLTGAGDSRPTVGRKIQNMKVQICDFSELQGKKIKNIDFISCFSPEIYPKIDSVAIKTYCGHTYLMQSHHTDEFADREDIIIRLESQSSDIIHRLLNFTIEDASIEKNTLFFRNNANDCYVWQKHIKFNISHENAAVSIEWLCESSREPEDADTLNKSLDVVFFKLIN